MVCSCQSKTKEKTVILKKPSRLPPPPPPPPRWPSPAQSFNSLNNRISYNYSGADSECYSEGPQSVRSVPYSTRSLQPPRRSFSPVAHCSCNEVRSTSECCTLSDYCSQCYPTCCANVQSRRYPVSCCETQSHHSVENAPPVPRERVFRPRLSISPIPVLKNNNNRGRLQDKCKPLNYRRHMEQHIEKLFKYLRDRQKRLDECEYDIIAKNLKEVDKESIRSLLAIKETRHLRSLRTRLSPKDFEEIKKLGAGYIGNVWLVRKIERNSSLSGRPNLYAMKKLRKSQVFQQNHMAHVMAERDIMAESDSEWIVKLYYSFQDELYLYFILEYIPGGDMMNLLYNQNVFSEEWARFYIAEISLALQFVHDMKFIHRDIKPDNILIDARGHIKLTDFGLCTGFRWTHDLSYYRDDTLNSGTNGNTNEDDHPTITRALTQREIEHSLKKRALSLVGSPNYIAPEVLRQDSTNERLCDWWSVGVILYEMVIGYCPFIDLQRLKAGDYDPRCDSPERIQMRILNWKNHLAFPSPNDPNSPPLMMDRHNVQRYISNETKSLIQGLLCDPHERLCQDGIKDIQNHPFFRGVDWQRIRSMPAPYVPELSGELDTRHFDQFAQSFETDGTIGTSLSARMSMNDFTYRSFWKRPISELQELRIN